MKATLNGHGIGIGLQSVRLFIIKRKNWMRPEMRVRLNKAKVQQYAREKKKKAKFPPPVLFFDENEIYWIGDGFHRIEADALNGEMEIECDVRRGELKDAILWNLKANVDSLGLPMSEGDKTKAAKTLLTEKCFKGWTYKQIASAITCSISTVAKAARIIGLDPRRGGCKGRRDITANDIAELRDKGNSIEDVASQLGCHPQTVRNRLRRGDLGKCQQGGWVTCPTCNGIGKVQGKTLKNAAD